MTYALQWLKKKLAITWPTWIPLSYYWRRVLSALLSSRMNNAEYGFGGYLTGTPEPMEDPRFPSFNFSVPVPALAPMPTRDMASMSPFNSSNVPSTGLSFQQQEMVRTTLLPYVLCILVYFCYRYSASRTKQLQLSFREQVTQRMRPSIPST